MANIKRENWNNRYYWVARNEKKQIQARRAVKGSKLTKAKAIEIYNANNTFKKDVKRVRTKLTNVTETVKLSKSSISNRNKKPISSKPTGKTVQYMVQGRYKGQVISARSQSIRKDTRARTASMAKDQAWESFLERIAQAAGLDYDADEGIKELSKVSNVQEGWVVYK